MTFYVIAQQRYHAATENVLPLNGVIGNLLRLILFLWPFCTLEPTLLEILAYRSHALRKSSLRSFFRRSWTDKAQFWLNLGVGAAISIRPANEPFSVFKSIHMMLALMGITSLLCAVQRRIIKREPFHPSRLLQACASADWNQANAFIHEVLSTQSVSQSAEWLNLCVQHRDREGCNVFDYAAM
jgi:hypothetical protein